VRARSRIDAIRESARDERAAERTIRAVPSLYDVKPGFQRLLRPFVGRLARAGVTPNQVTLMAVALSVAGSAVLCLGAAPWSFLVIPIVSLVRMALNAIDGMLAREHDMQTKLGALLNELGDVVSDAALYLPFALVPGFSGPLVVVLVLLGVLGEMTGVVAVQIGAVRRYDGPLGKSDRALFFSLLAVGMATGWLPPAWIEPVLWAAVALAALTVWNRARAALREAHG
jgi:CDP-diacylglycerol--glycerol-3-phosphate 3-phosphatidyltransferase